VVGKDVPVVGEWNEIRRYDLKTGSTVVRRTGSTKLGEAVFAPRDGSVDENDGYLLVYAYDTETLNTNLLVLHASDIAGEPAATIQLPQRVPFGLHGSWIPA
jgi:carotenoid cleavage dioxygenase-like enzyme